MNTTKTSHRFQAGHAARLLVPILLGALVLVLAGVIAVTLLAVLGMLPG